MIESINELLEHNEIQVRIGTRWFRLEEIHVNDGKMPIFVSDEDGEDHEFDMADIDEFDPAFEAFKGMDNHITGIA